SASVRGLRRLRLGRNPLQRKGLLALAGSEPLRSLTTLDLSGGVPEARDEDVVAFLRQLALPGLRHLLLDELTLRHAGARALAANPHLGGLALLSVRRCGIRAAGARALRESPTLQGLRVLDLTGNEGGGG